MTRIVGIPVEAAQLQFERRQQKWVAFDSEVIAEQQGTANFYQEVGLIKQHMDVKVLFDPGFEIVAG